MAESTPHAQASGPKRIILDLLADADVQVNGSRPWDIRVHNEATYARVISQGSLGLGEAYMDAWWDCDAIDVLFEKMLVARLDQKLPRSMRAAWFALWARTLNLQSKARAFQVGQRHYDLGNDLYKAMLDERMIYSCGYWANATTLEEAQEHKLDLVCRKIGLQQGQHVLDIGCGWGGFAKFAAQRYGAKVTGVTVSKEQQALALETCKGLPVNIILEDYRDLRGQYDHIISIGMFEHVGFKNYRTYFETVRRCLKRDGLFLLHTIGSSVLSRTEPWIHTYIFPNGLIPAASQIAWASEGLFTMEDWHNFGVDYDPTLLAWHERFEKAWPNLHEKYGERFHRMWRYYLLMCAGMFRSRDGQLWQIVFSPFGVRGGYRSVR